MDIPRRQGVKIYRRFGSLAGPIIWVSGTERRTEKSVYFDHWTPRNNPEAPDININRSESLKSRKLIDTRAA